MSKIKKIQLNKSREVKDNLTSGEFDIAMMFKFSDNKRKLAKELMWRYGRQLTSFQKAKCCEYMTFLDRWTWEVKYLKF